MSAVQPAASQVVHAVSGSVAEGGGLAALRRRALSLSAANAFDYAVQFMLPIVLARCLDPAAFGQYRLMWLVVMTIMAVAPMSMPQGLYFFLPRSGSTERRLYVHQTMIFLGAAGLFSAWIVSPWNPLLPPGVHALVEFGGLVPVFVALWVSACLLDILPTVEERAGLQARYTMSLSALRAVVLSVGAWLTGDLLVLIWLLVGLISLKMLLLLDYVRRHHGLQGPWFQRAAFIDQVRHAAPFGGSSALYGLRSQADQWVAASLFSLGSFAAFSVAVVLGPMVNLFRQSVNHSFLPSMSRQHAGNDVRGMLKLNSQANVMVAVLVFPVLAFAFGFAEDMVSLVYTSAYLEAAPVMRLYILSLCAFVVELVSIMMLLREGSYALRVNLLLIVVSVLLSWFCAQRFGLTGAAVGSVLCVYADRLANLRRIATRTGIAVRHLQDWNTLARLLACAVIAGAVAWLSLFHYLEYATGASGHVTRLAVGGSLLALTYALMLSLFGMSRETLGFAGHHGKAAS